MESKTSHAEGSCPPYPRSIPPPSTRTPSLPPYLPVARRVGCTAVWPDLALSGLQDAGLLLDPTEPAVRAVEPPLYPLILTTVSIHASKNIKWKIPKTNSSELLNSVPLRVAFPHLHSSYVTHVFKLISFLIIRDSCLQAHLIPHGCLSLIPPSSLHSVLVSFMF